MKIDQMYGRCRNDWIQICKTENPPWVEDLDMTFDASLGISWLAYPLDPATDQATDMVNMVEVKGWLPIRNFTFVFLTVSDSVIRSGIRVWLKGDKIVRTNMESHFTLCGEMELMNREKIFAPPENTHGELHKDWRHIRIRAHCPQNVQFAPKSMVVVHGGEMLKNENFDIRWATRGPKALPAEVAQPILLG